MKMRRVPLIVFPVIVVAVLALACLSAEAAQSENGPKSELTGTGDSGPAVKAEPAGNETCPVSGEKIDPKESITYEYKGKVYNFCCQGCVEQFKKDPEMYIRKMEKERPEPESRNRPSMRTIISKMEVTLTEPLNDRRFFYRWASALALITIFYNSIEGCVSVFFGLQDETIALFGFGLDSFVEVVSGIGIWHMVRRMKQSDPVIHDSFEKEHCG